MDMVAYSVVMPVYNEEAHIYVNMRQTADALRLLGSFELIMVDDGSVDRSRAEMTRARSEIPEAMTLHLQHAGKGEALRRGAQAARGEFVIFLDADLDLPPEQLLFFIAVQKAKKADAVIGSKMHPDSTVDYPLLRRCYSRGYFILTKILFNLPVRDTQTGLKLIRRDLLLKALEHTEVRGFALDLELLVRLVQLNAKMVEAPVVVNYHMRFGGVGLSTIYEILKETFRVWKRSRLLPTSQTI